MFCIKLTFFHILSLFSLLFSFFFFFNDTATTEIYTLSLHDALPISDIAGAQQHLKKGSYRELHWHRVVSRSEEHTSELQSPDHLVCRLLLEKKKKNTILIYLSIRPMTKSTTIHMITSKMPR